MHKGIDLNSKPVQPMLPRLLRQRRADEFWQIDLSHNRWTFFPQKVSGAVSNATRAITNSRLFLAGISSFAWPSRS